MTSAGPCPPRDVRVVSLAPKVSPDQVRFEVDPPLTVIDVDPLQMSPFISVREDRLYRLHWRGNLTPAKVSDFAAGDSIRVWPLLTNTRGWGEESAAVALIR